jgi:beta-xylosidase
MKLPPIFRAVAAAAMIAGVVMLGATAPAQAASPGPAPSAESHTYLNPVSAPAADTFADPSIIRGTDGFYYAYATGDPLKSGQTTPRQIPIMRSPDMIHWTYIGDVFSTTTRPAWATPAAGLWAPDIRYYGGRYVLYYTVTDTTLNADDDSAIGVATAPAPAGPWTDSGAPIVKPRPASGGGFLWTFDPAGLVDANGQHWLYYGSYFGGVQVVPVTADGLRVTGAPTQITIDNRYEGTYVVRHDGWYYLFGSAANCCAGPTTGYSVFAGRSTSPTGPFVDKDGISLLASRVGGTPVIQPNGNKWVGTGHNAVVTDAAGQNWFVYHAIDKNQPYLNEPYGINRRAMLIDRLEWVNGWPTVNNGHWASDKPMPGPVTDYRAAAHPQLDVAEPPRVGSLLYGDEFSGSQLGAGWTWIRQDSNATVSGGSLNWPTEATDLVGSANTAGVLVRQAPRGDYVAETKLTLDLGVDAVRNYEQAGLVVYAGDDNFARLDSVAIWNTRQIEYGREMPYAGSLSYGGIVEGAPAPTIWLRVAHTTNPQTGEQDFRAGWSRDGLTWEWGGTWTFGAGTTPRIGLVSQGGNNPSVTAMFDYFRVYR